MKFTATCAVLASFVISHPAQADESVLILGKGVYNSLCTNCHGPDGKGMGEIGQLFSATPPDLTKLAKQAGGQFPFADTYTVIINGRKVVGHGPLEMPVWGDYFMADALQDRGLSKSDAMFAATGRALSVTYYLESIQE